MTRMIPPTINPDIKSNAERRVFEIIRNEAGTEDWVCLHSLGLTEHEFKRYAEIDFLLLTRLGIFVLEVKGGRVARKDGIWTFTNRYEKTTKKHEGPFAQASGAMFALEKKVREHFKDSDRNPRPFLYGSGVILPDCELNNLGTEGDPQQLYDRQKIKVENVTFKSFIEELASFSRDQSSRGGGLPRYAPTKKDIDNLIEFLRGDFDKVLSVGAMADAISHEMHALGSDQYAVLDILEHLYLPRVVIQGGAGTGKTLLAAEIAKRKAEQNDAEILLLCFNRNLASALRKNIEVPSRGQISAWSLHALMLDIINESSLKTAFDDAKKRCGNKSDIFNNLMPEFALNALLGSQNEIKQYPVLVVDEAQDLLSKAILDFLDALVVGGLSKGSWWFFTDINNQASVYGHYEEKAFSDLISKSSNTQLLPHNRRNTIQIARDTEIKTQPDFPPSARISGIPVDTKWYKNHQDQQLFLKQVINKLLANGVQPRQITVLSSKKNGCAYSLDKFTEITDENSWKIGTTLLNEITACTVSSFKGLENDFIILTDVENLTTDWWRGVVYVGMSRARIGLSLFVDKKLESLCNQRAYEWNQRYIDKNPVEKILDA